MRLLLATILFSCGCSDNLKTYENYGDRIKVKYPVDWTYKEGVMGSVVTFVASSAPSKEFAENLSIVVQDLGGQEISLKQYTDIVIKQMGRLVPGSRILESGPIFLSKRLGHKAVSVFQQGPLKLKILQAWTIIDSKSYMLTFTAEEKEYQELENTINKILRSFKVM